MSCDCDMLTSGMCHAADCSEAIEARLSRPARLDFIETVSGRRFRPLVPEVGEIVIGDIAHALSQQCRFSGHTCVPYSVAEHSVRVAELLQRWGCSRMVQLWGLLHDASEAYLVDIPSPLKNTNAFAAYREAESRLMSAVCVRFGLPVEEPRVVRFADAELLATEARDLMPYLPEHWFGLTGTPLVETIKPWHATSAKREFLALFEELSR